MDPQNTLHLKIAQQKKSAVKSAKSPGTSRSKGDLVDWVSLVPSMRKRPEPLDFVLPGLLAGTVGALVGPGAVGKTMLALQAAVTVAGGADTLGLASMDSEWRCKTGKVVFLNVEDPEIVLVHRIHAIGQRLNSAEKETVAKNLFVTSLFGSRVDLMAAKWRRWIADAIQGARLIVIDALRRFHSLDESSSHMADLLAYLEHLCRKEDAALLFLECPSTWGEVLASRVGFQASLVDMTPKEARRFGLDESRCRNFVKLLLPTSASDRWLCRHDGGVLGPVACPSYYRQLSGRRMRQEV